MDSLLSTLFSTTNVHESSVAPGPPAQVAGPSAAQSPPLASTKKLPPTATSPTHVKSTTINTPTTGGNRTRGTKRVSYQERDAEEYEGGFGSSEEEDEVSDGGEEGDLPSQLDWRKVFESELNKKIKPDKAVTQKLKLEMEGILNKAIEESQALIDTQANQTARVFEALGINRGGGENERETQTQAATAKFHGTIRPERYRLAIDSQRAATLELVEKVDRYLETSHREDQVWIEETKVQLENRKKVANQTKRKLSKVVKQVIDERREMSMNHLNEGKKELGHLKAALKK
ncbi:hypothetical protein JCM16303_002759 [Sporobolomyces ruberrimus]